MTNRIKNIDLTGINSHYFFKKIMRRDNGLFWTVNEKSTNFRKDAVSMQQSINYIMNIMHLERDLKRLTSNWSSATGLSLNELRILVYVEQHPGIQIGDVANALNVAKASLAQNIGTLITQGWLKSQPIKQDRRLRVLTLTKAGQDRMKDVDAQLTKSLDTTPATQLADQLSALQL